jgi:hypothetical protein
MFIICPHALAYPMPPMPPMPLHTPCPILCTPCPISPWSTGFPCLTCSYSCSSSLSLPYLLPAHISSLLLVPSLVPTFGRLRFSGRIQSDLTVQTSQAHQLSSENSRPVSDKGARLHGSPTSFLFNLAYKLSILHLSSDELISSKIEPPISGRIRNLATLTWNMDLIFLHTC